MALQICPNCGEENPAKFRLCGFCGTALARELPQREVRKTVTIVFSDLQGSTSLGERLDSEALREVLSRYFDTMRAVLEEHGGLLEKYIGDAIMAVFGLPRAHEDDAVRAVSATVAMQQALGALNEHLERRWGVRLTNRTGVNTGEVVTGDATTAQRLISGDAVNVAARLEQAAPPLGVLVGEPTYRLVRHAFEVEALPPLELKGKAERVPAYRVLGPKQRRDSSPAPEQVIVGRERELELLSDALDEVTRETAARVVAVTGDPGIGKTRLIQAFVGRCAASARVLRGRCLSYGRGITFWPLVEIVREAAAIHDSDTPESARDKLRTLAPDAPDVVARVASAIGMNEETFPLEEIYWGARKLFELLAMERPLVLILEDAHWAESAFLDLIEHVAQQFVGPLLIVCTGRPELLEARPEWRNDSRWRHLEIEPLGATESALLLQTLLGTGDLPPTVRDRVSQAAEGNPLFLEQLVAMLLDEGYIRQDTGVWRIARDLPGSAVPGSIQALLAARLDALSPQQRAVLEPASVMGQLFPEDALLELVPDSVRPDLSALLSDLMRKRLVQPAADEAGGRWYRFQHILIRDAAYGGLLKRTRASLHERFVDWGERVNRDREGATEYDEIHGYHLEQAYQYLCEVGLPDDHARQIGARGATRLGQAGQRAFERGDMGAASNLLGRALALLPEGARDRVELVPFLSEALMESGEFGTAQQFLNEATAAAAAWRDERLTADVVLSQLLVRRAAISDLGAWCSEIERETARLIPVLERIDAHAELAKAWRLAAFVHGSACRWKQVVAAEERGIEHARSSGRKRLEARMSAALVQALRDGPTPVREAIQRCEAILADGLVDQQAEAIATLHLAYLQALAGDLDRGRETYRAARLRLADLGGGTLTARAFASLTIGRIELLADMATVAAEELGREFEALGQVGERYFRPLVGALLSEALFANGRYEEALAMTSEVELLAAVDDIEAQAMWRSVRAKVLARSGAGTEAIALADEAVGIVAPADAPVMKADMFVDQASVLMCVSDADMAWRALDRARSLYRAKAADLPLRRVSAMLAGVESLADAAPHGRREPAEHVPAAIQRSRDRSSG